MYQPAPAGLRSLARLAGAHPRSAELAIKALVKERLVKKTRHTAGPRYALNRKHPDARTLDAVFTAAARAVVFNRSQQLNQRAARILGFIREADRLLTHAKGPGHET